MFPLRILGGPIAKSDRIVVDVSPSTTFSDIFLLIQRVLPQANPPITTEYFDLMELQVVDGQKAKPISVYKLQATPASVNMSTPVVFLKRNDRPFTMQQNQNQNQTPVGSPSNVARLGRSQSVSFAQGLEDGSGGGSGTWSSSAAAAAAGDESPPLLLKKFQSFAFTEPIARGALAQAMLQDSQQEQQNIPPPLVGSSSPLLRSASVGGSSGSFYLGSSAEKYMMPPAHRTNSVVADFDASPDGSGIFGPMVAAGSPQQQRTSRSSRYSVEQASISSLASSVGPASNAREQLLKLFGVVNPVEQPARVALINQLLRKAARMNRIDDFIASTETVMTNTANSNATILASESILSLESQVASSSSSSSPAVAGSPMNVLRRAKSIAAMETGLAAGGGQLTRQQVRHIQFRTLCNNVLWKVLDAFLPAERLAQADVVAFFLDEVREMPKSHIAALAFRFLVQKTERMDFERDVQFERFDLELIEFVKREQLRRLLIIRTFFVGWCTWQRFFLINHEQMDRFRIWDQEELDALQYEQSGFVLVEMCRRWNIIGMERRQRHLIKLFDLQVFEQSARDVIIADCLKRFRLIEFERELAHADRIRDRIARSCWQGFLQILLARTVDQQLLHRQALMKKEFRTRLLLLELYEQLHRKFMEDKILEWVTPIMKKIALKAIEDGKILLAVELKERQYANARYEARQRSMSKDRRPSGAF